MFDKQQQSIPFAKRNQNSSLDQRVRQKDTAPDAAKLVVAGIQFQDGAQFASRNFAARSSFFESRDQIAAAQTFRNLRGE